MDMNNLDLDMECTNMVFGKIFQKGEKITKDEASRRICDVAVFAIKEDFPKDFLITCAVLQSVIAQMDIEQFEKTMDLYIK